MNDYKLEIDIYGVWQDLPPVYRIYIDDEMICERTYYAMEYEFCTEEIIVNLEVDKEYSFYFQSLPSSSPNNNNRLSVKNLRLNGKPITNTFTVPN